MCLHYLVKVIARVLSPYITNTPCFVTKSYVPQLQLIANNMSGCFFLKHGVNSVQLESLSWSGSKFQTVGPATENARRSSVLRRWRGTVSGNHLSIFVVSYSCTLSSFLGKLYWHGDEVMRHHTERQKPFH